MDDKSISYLVHLFVWEPTNVASFGGKYQIDLLISSCCFWFYLFDFVFDNGFEKLDSFF